MSPTVNRALERFTRFIDKISNLRSWPVLGRLRWGDSTIECSSDQGHLVTSCAPERKILPANGSRPASEPAMAENDLTYGLALQVRAGSESAIGPWFDVEAPRIFRICLGFLTSPLDAQEMAQECLAHLLDALSEWSPEVSYRRWSTTVVANLCRDRLRRRGARNRALATATEIGASLPTPLPDPSDLAAAKEVQRILIEALKVLPPREREVFVLRDLEGQEFVDIAAALGSPESTVRALLSTGRERLRALLGPKLSPTLGGTA